MKETKKDGRARSHKNRHAHAHTYGASADGVCSTRGEGRGVGSGAATNRASTASASLEESKSVGGRGSESHFCFIHNKVEKGKQRKKRREHIRIALAVSRVAGERGAKTGKRERGVPRGAVWHRVSSRESFLFVFVS